MALRIDWSRGAIQDLEAIAEFIAADSRAYAAVVVRNVIGRTKLLEQFPRSGKKVPEFDDEDIREVVAYNYRIIYQVQRDRVLITAVIHGKRILQ